MDGTIVDKEEYGIVQKSSKTEADTNGNTMKRSDKESCVVSYRNEV